MTDLPASSRPFVLALDPDADLTVRRAGELDLYHPAGTARTGAILFVPGEFGPVPDSLAGEDVLPRDSARYRGYATAAAQRGLVAGVAEHSLRYGLDRLTTAADDVEAAVGVLRSDPRVDPARVVLWFFSGSALLAGEWLDSRPEWLRGVLLSYPVLVTPPGVDELVTTAEVIGKHKDLPVLLTRVGRERDELAGPVAELVSAGGTALDIIDVPKGQHGFDMLDHDEESRAAVTKALDWAIAHLGQDATTPSTSIPTTSTPTTSTRTTRSTAAASRRPSATAGATAVGTPADTRSPAAASPRPSAATRPTTSTSAAPAGVAPAGAAPVAASTTTHATSAAPAGAASATLPATGVSGEVGLFSSGASGVAEVTAVDPQVLGFGGGQLSVPAETPASRVVAREHSAYAAHDLEAFLALYSPTAQLQLADGAILKGRRSLREYYRPRFEAGRCKTETLQRMTLGEWVVEQSVTHDSDQGPTPTIALYRVQEGLIVEVRFLA